MLEAIKLRKLFVLGAILVVLGLFATPVNAGLMFIGLIILFSQLGRG